MEMSRASFDTWVRDTRFLGWDDGNFNVGARNAYAREWLESRLLSTVERLLAGMLNQSVSVRFVVDNREGEGSEEDADPVDGADEDDQSKDEVQVEAVWESSYEQIVRLEKAIALNAYFLRHLRELRFGDWELR